MSGTHAYGLEAEIENPALRELLLKHKQAGAFDMIKAHCLGVYGHLLIAEAIDGAEHDFSFKDASLARSGAAWAFPRNVHQLLPFIVTILARTAYYPSEEKAASFSFRDDVMAHRDEIYRSYRYARCWRYRADAEHAAGGSAEEAFFEIDREGKASYKETRRIIDENDAIQSTATEDGGRTSYLLLPEQSEEMRSRSQKEEAEAALLLGSIQCDLDPDDGQDDTSFRLPLVRGWERDIRHFRIWQESEEGRREGRKARAETREHMAAELEKMGGDACPIDVLDLEHRPYDCLVRANISTIGALRKMTFDDIIQVRNMGRKSAYSLVRRLAEYGIIVPGAPEWLLQ